MLDIVVVIAKNPSIKVEVAIHLPYGTGGRSNVDELLSCPSVSARQHIHLEIELARKVRMSVCVAC